MNAREENIAKNIAAIREMKNFTGSEIVQGMKERGHDWHISFISKIEHGRRRVFLSEASDLAEVLEVPLRLLIDDADDAAMRSAQRTLAVAQSQYDIANERLNDALDELTRLETQAVSA